MTRDEILKMPAGEELDEAIAKAYLPKRLADVRYLRFNPSTNIADTLMVVDELDGRFALVLSLNDPPSTEEYKWWCELTKYPAPHKFAEAYGSTQQLALCRAALLAALEFA